MKKTLLELMVGADVEWPQGANFAAQNKRGSRLYFYEEKPTRVSGDEAWDVDCGDVVIIDCTLPSLCKNWHQSVVTREQYEAAKVNLVRVSDVLPEALDTPNTLDIDKKFLEEKLSDYQWANNKLAKAVATVADWTNKIKELEDEIAAELASFGWCGEVKPVGELNITDWRDLQVGDIIDCDKSSHYGNKFDGATCEVIAVDRSEEDISVKVKFPCHTTLWCLAFKFIDRPIKD